MPAMVARPQVGPDSIPSVSGHFQFRRSGRSADEPWFHIGTLEVTSIMFLVITTVLMWVVVAIDPALPAWLVLDTERLWTGEVWRLFTWPFAASVSFGSAASLLFLWLFGREIEETVGRVRMAWLLFWLAVVVVAADLFVAAALQSWLQELGVWKIGLYVLGVWVMEYPHRRMIFNIPSWVFGVAIVFIQVLTMITARAFVDLLAFVLGLLLAAVAARSLGLLTDYPQIPKLGGPRRRRRPRSRIPRVPRSQRRYRADDLPHETVVEGPWISQRNRDQERLDALLDKIHANGMDSLSQPERSELVELSERLRSR